MSGHTRKATFVALFLLFVAISTASAKVYWLPDYLGDNADRTNTSSFSSGTVAIDNDRLCPNGWLSESQIGDMDCVLKGSFPWVGLCYGDCVCDEDVYPYTSDNCNGTYSPTGSSCDDGEVHYTQCRNLCNDVTNQSCTYGCASYYAVCPSKCETCYTDNCRSRTGKTCTYGCASYYADCSTACETCYSDNCRNRTSKTCEYGCASYYADCSSKCESCDTCTANDCSDYTLSSCPSNGNCTWCTPGCGDSVKRFRLDSCDSGYSKNGNTCEEEVCVPASCSGYSLSHCPNNGNCGSCDDGCGTMYYKLNSCDYGYKISNNSCIEDCSVSCSGYGSASDPICSDKRAEIDYCPCSASYANCSCPSGYQWSCNGEGCVTDAYWEAHCGECSGYTDVSPCDYGCKTYYATPCDSMCKTCYSDNCHNRTGKTCTYGCESYYDDCDSKCETCYSDNCRNRTGKTCTYGCESYYDDCDSKCETCCDFSGYNLTMCPANGICSFKECGNTKKCSLDDCDTGYYLDGNSCKSCDYGCGFSSSSVANGTTTKIECGGQTKYDIAGCNDGYEVSGCSCVSTACVPNNSCSGYDLTNQSDPNATYDSCTDNCGTTTYKKTGCKNGYEGDPCTEIDPCKDYDDARPCDYGCKTWYPSPCADMCEICYSDNCHNRTAKTCTYGCASYYDDCDSKCETCYSDNCHNRTAKTCTYGCASYYDDCASKCETCYSDNCRNRTGKTCTYGCASYYDDCDSKCETCYSDNCHNRTGKTCEYGCESFYADCSTACETCYSDNCHNRTAKNCTYCASYYDDCPSKCETCCDFSGYNLTTCPAGGICSEKTCGGKTLYKLDSCQECYQMSGTTMCILDRCCTVEDVGPCEYGCKVQQALPCASKCKTCKTACESVTAVSCSYGCKSYYSICPSKCEVCNSAPACDCSGYGSAYSEICQADKHVVVDSCPCNSSYANCYCESGYQYDENNMSCMTEAYMCANYGEYC